MRFAVEIVTLGKIAVRVLRGLPCQYHSINSPPSSSFTCCCYQKDEQEKPVKLPISNDVSGGNVSVNKAGDATGRIN